MQFSFAYRRENLGLGDFDIYHVQGVWQWTSCTSGCENADSVDQLIIDGFHGFRFDKRSMNIIVNNVCSLVEIKRNLTRCEAMHD